MSERLMAVIQEFLVRDGAGLQKLAIAVEKHQSTVQRWITAGRIPDGHDRFLVALACGLTNKEAVALAGEASQTSEKKESA